MSRLSLFRGKFVIASALAIVMAAGLFARPAHAATANIVGSSNANITGSSVNTTYPPSSYGLVVNVFDNTRAVIEFPTTALPSNAVIQSLSFDFEQVSHANQTSVVNIMGFADNGTITGADATAAATQMGSYSAVALGLGDHSVTLTPATLQSLVGTGQHLALRLQSGSADTNTSIASIQDAAFWTPPTLAV